jgi:hypothetical protein
LIRLTFCLPSRREIKMKNLLFREQGVHNLILKVCKQVLRSLGLRLILEKNFVSLLIEIQRLKSLDREIKSYRIILDSHNDLSKFIKLSNLQMDKKFLP